MKPKSRAITNRPKTIRTPDGADFAALDVWAKNLKLSDGRKLTAAERLEERQARKIGRSVNRHDAKAHG
jgi:hypothetical protein